MRTVPPVKELLVIYQARPQAIAKALTGRPLGGELLSPCQT